MVKEQRKKVNSTQCPMFRSVGEYMQTCSFKKNLHNTVHIFINNFIFIFKH